MQFEERYAVNTWTADGVVTTDEFDDMAEALEDYTLASRALGPGERAELRRFTSVTLASSAKA